jgi:hypothetical protein
MMTTGYSGAAETQRYKGGAPGFVPTPLMLPSLADADAISISAYLELFCIFFWPRIYPFCRRKPRETYQMSGPEFFPWIEVHIALQERRSSTRRG